MNHPHLVAGSCFAVPQVDIVRRTNVRALIISFVYILLSIGTIAVSLHLGDRGSTFNTLLITLGTILLLWGIFSLFWRSHHWVYVPTSSPLLQDTVYFDVADLSVLLSELKNPTKASQHVASVKVNGNVRLDYVFSRDHQFLSAQLYRFVPYTYEPVSPVFYFTGQESQVFLQRLKTNSF